MKGPDGKRIDCESCRIGTIAGPKARKAKALLVNEDQRVFGGAPLVPYCLKCREKRAPGGARFMSLRGNVELYFVQTVMRE